ASSVFLSSDCLAPDFRAPATSCGPTCSLGQSACVDSLLCLGVVPGEPILDRLSDGASVLLKRRQVIEGIDSIELTRVDNAHEDVPDPSPSESHKGQGVFAM